MRSAAAVGDRGLLHPNRSARPPLAYLVDTAKMRDGLSPGGLSPQTQVQKQRRAKLRSKTRKRSAARHALNMPWPALVTPVDLYQWRLIEGS
jgi:hypothetical protein